MTDQVAADPCLTVPAEITETTAWYFTGNEYVALPEISPTHLAIESVNLVHRGARGLIEFCRATDASLAAPLVKPLIFANDLPLDLSQARWQRRLDWLPAFTLAQPTADIEGIICA